MKNQKEEKDSIFKSKNSHSASSKTEVKEESSVITLLWQKLLVNSQLKLFVDKGFFHYEIYIHGDEVKKPQDKKGKYQSVSKIKFCVSEYEYKGRLYHFLVNPVDRISRCIEEPSITIKWHGVVFKQPVLQRKELNYEEQLNVHLGRLESLIKSRFIPEIENALSACVAKSEDFA